MTDRLADLVLPDSTPVEQLPEEPPVKAAKEAPPQRKMQSDQGGSDWLVTVTGIGLAVLCALFPWYIFINQESFGVRPLSFSGSQFGREGGGIVGRWDLAEEYAPLEWGEVSMLDFRPTGTVPDMPAFEEGDIPHQPFPGDRLAFRLIDAGYGRAMIEDREGFWLVERGSPLPDGSKVAEIVEHDGMWVLVTSEDAVFRLSR